jgi:hypothetical protein
MLKYTKPFVYKPERLKDRQREEQSQKSSLLFKAGGDLGGE